jgi:hypothetical protein
MWSTNQRHQTSGDQCQQLVASKLTYLAVHLTVAKDNQDKQRQLAMVVQVLFLET